MHLRIWRVLASSTIAKLDVMRSHLSTIKQIQINLLLLGAPIEFAPAPVATAPRPSFTHGLGQLPFRGIRVYHTCEARILLELKLSYYTCFFVISSPSNDFRMTPSKAPFSLVKAALLVQYH
jgi:hypothetical protein